MLNTELDVQLASVLNNFFRIKLVNNKFDNEQELMTYMALLAYFEAHCKINKLQLDMFLKKLEENPNYFEDGMKN